MPYESSCAFWPDDVTCQTDTEKVMLQSCIDIAKDILSFAAQRSKSFERYLYDATTNTI
jgi:hypothetical protein